MGGLKLTGNLFGGGFTQNPVGLLCRLFKRTLKAVQESHILKVLDEQNWQITRSAEILGINRVSLHKIIERCNLKKRA